MSRFIIYPAIDIRDGKCVRLYQGDGWMDGWVGGRMDGWVEGWMNGWMDGLID